MYTKTPKSFSKYIFLDFGKKFIVTIFSTKKRDCEHYGLSDGCIVFFKSKTFFCKMDIYFCPFLKNPKYFWKKRFTSFTSASALPILCGLPLCFAWMIAVV